MTAPDKRDTQPSKGDVALIVGGGPGISASCARLFAKNGSRVAGIFFVPRSFYVENATGAFEALIGHPLRSYRAFAQEAAAAPRAADVSRAADYRLGATIATQPTGRATRLPCASHCIGC